MEWNRPVDQIQYFYSIVQYKCNANDQGSESELLKYVNTLGISPEAIQYN